MNPIFILFYNTITNKQILLTEIIIANRNGELLSLWRSWNATCKIVLAPLTSKPEDENDKHRPIVKQIPNDLASYQWQVKMPALYTWNMTNIKKRFVIFLKMYGFRKFSWKHSYKVLLQEIHLTLAGSWWFPVTYTEARRPSRVRLTIELLRRPDIRSCGTGNIMNYRKDTQVTIAYFSF